MNTLKCRAVSVRLACLLVASFGFVSATFAQVHTSEVFTVNARSNGFDVRDFKPYTESLSAEARLRASSSSNAASGYKWIERISNMPGYMHELYDEYKTNVDKVLDGENNWVSDPTLSEMFGDGQYGVCATDIQQSIEFEYTDEMLNSGELQDVVYRKVAEHTEVAWDEANVFFHYMWMSMVYDVPEAFWVSNYCRWSERWQYSYRYGNGVCRVDYEQKIYFVLCDENDGFDIRRERFRNASTLSSSIPQYHKAVNSIVAGVPKGASRYETLLHFNNWLTKHNYYNPYFHSEGNTDMAWSAFSALTGMTTTNAPVCESYAKAFNVLCNKVGVPCKCVVGFAKGRADEAGESHMWNEVQMDDRKWYAVDVTWNDPIVKGKSQVKVSGYESEFWFLLGGEESVADDLIFSDSHPLSIAWDIDSYATDQWKVDLGSLIADYRYEPGSVTPVTIADITNLIDIYLQDGANADMDECDIDGDGKLTISDITELINIYLASE